MNTKKLSARLKERARAYEDPYGEDKDAFLKSGSSYAIATTLREIAFALTPAEDKLIFTDDQGNDHEVCEACQGLDGHHYEWCAALQDQAADAHDSD